MGFFIDNTAFNRGWIDAYNSKPAKEDSAEYLAGWKHGKSGKY